MPEAARREDPALSGDGARESLALVSALPRVPLLHLLRPKWLTARVRARGGERGRGARIALLGILGVLFWAFVLVVVFRLLLYFRRVPDIGPLLAGKLLGIIFVSFFSIHTPVEHHHRALELLRGAGSRPSRFRAGRLLRLYGQAARDGGALELDGHPDGVPIFVAYGVAYEVAGGSHSSRWPRSSRSCSFPPWSGAPSRCCW